MKKLSSFFVLMLIALMLFVSCNNSTPTKEIPTERAATDDDYTLYATLYNVLMNDVVRRNVLPNGCTREQDNSTNTISLTFDSCEFDSYNLDGSQLPVKLNGIATIKTEGEPESDNYVEYHTCNFTEGSSLGDTKFTINLEFSTNNSGINFTTATINGIKINGLSELVNSKAIREATDEDEELAIKIIEAINYIISLSEDTQGINREDKENYVVEYTFTEFDFTLENGTTYFFNGTLTTTPNLDDHTVDFSIDFVNNGTKIDDINHSVIAEGIQTIDTTNNNSTFNFQKAVIDFTYITNLVVVVPNPNTNTN